MTRYATEVDNAIREAFARGDRPSDVRVKLKAGTLSGIDRPVEMAERTFWNKWGKAKREQGTPRGGDGTFSILDRVAFDMARRDAGLEDEDDPKVLAEALGVGVRKAKRCLEHLAEREQERVRLTAEQRQRELVWKERRAKAAQAVE